MLADGVGIEGFDLGLAAASATVAIAADFIILAASADDGGAASEAAACAWARAKSLAMAAFAIISTA